MEHEKHMIPGAPVPRTCATCSSFVDGECLNMVSFMEAGQDLRAPIATDDGCRDHTTAEEDRLIDVALERYRAGLGPIPKNFPRIQENSHE